MNSKQDVKPGDTSLSAWSVVVQSCIIGHVLAADEKTARADAERKYGVAGDRPAMSRRAAIFEDDCFDVLPPT